MTVAPRLVCVVALSVLVFGRAPGTGAAPPRRVWLLAPAIPGAEPAVALLRAEIAASGFAVEERPAPGLPSDRSLQHPPVPDAFATVVPDLAAGRAAATVLVYSGASAPARRHRVDLGDLSWLGEAEALRRLTTLSVRVAEVLRAHAGDPGAVAAAALPRPPPGTPAHALLLELGLGAANAVTGKGAAVLPWLGLSARHRRGPLARLALMGPGVGRSLRAAGGRVLVLDTSALLELGYELGFADQSVALAASAGGGVQHTLAHGRPAAGYEGGSDGTLSPAASATLGLALPAHGSWSVVAGLRVHHLFRRPEFWIADERVRLAPALQLTGWFGLRLSL